MIVNDEPFTPGPSAFARNLVLWNGLVAAGFAAWEFLPGMRFSERAAWWRGGAERGSAHQGLDICWYRTVDGRRLSLGAGARVPAIYPGTVAAVVDDFLGVSLFMAHECHNGRGWRLHTIFGHISPGTGLVPGTTLGDGEEIGTIADTSGRKSAVPPHLHVSMALIDRAGAAERLDWGALGDRSRVMLLDPLIIMN